MSEYQSSFTAVAPYYDVLMEEVPYEQWVRYYLKLLKFQRTQPKKLLDLCCGTGTLTEKLFLRGFELIGLDISAGMIERAREKAEIFGHNIEYYVADCSSFELPHSFDACYSFFDSLNYVIDPSKLMSTFKCVAKHLNPRSSFIFDLNTEYSFQSGMFNQSDFDRKAKIQYKWESAYDSASRIVKVKMNFWYKGQRFRELHVERAHPVGEVEQMLRDAGFDEINIFSSYSFNKLDPRSDRVHFVCKLLK